MGMWLFESWGNKDTQIVEEIAKEHKLDVKKVAEAYKEMVEELKNETQE